MAIYHYEDATNPYAPSIGAMLAQRGQIAADAAAREGALRGESIRSVGGMLAAIPQQMQAAKEAEQRRALTSQELAINDLKMKASTVAQQKEVQAEHDADASALGYAIHTAGNTPEAVQAALGDFVQRGKLQPAEAQQFATMAASDPAKIPLLSRQLIGRTPEGRAALLKTVSVRPGGSVVAELTGQTVASAPAAPEKPTEAGLAADAANPNSPTAAQSRAAIDLLKPPRPEPVPRPLDQQLLEAIANGDTEKADQIKQTLRTRAEATKDPAQVALANELGNLRKDEAKARIDALQKKNAPLDIEPDIQTTVAGRKYVDISGYTGDERKKARDAANTAGVIPISKENADALKEIDNARLNQHAILDQIGDLLPKGVGGRAVASVTVPLEKLFQTNDQIAAFNTWRTSAIQTLRATAGSKGLRINQAEIAQAIENDIPKLTDTVGVAQQKVRNIETMLENGERSILVRDRSVQAPMTGPATPPPLTPGLQRLSERK